MAATVLVRGLHASTATRRFSHFREAPRMPGPEWRRNFAPQTTGRQVGL
jgi:hypothetical protein